MSRSILALSAVFLAAGDAAAEPVTPDWSIGPDEDYSVVVVGKRQPEPSFLSDRSTSQVTRETLAERAPRTTPEALWETPGVFVQQTNHGGGSPILRGMIGPQNLILVDGVRLNNSVYRTGPLQYLNLLDPFALERLEVLLGPGSVLYGSDAMGGVIRAQPLVPRTAGGGAAHVGYASANQGAEIHGHVDGGRGGLAALGGVTYRALNDLVGGRGIGRQVHSGYDHISTLGTVAYRVVDGPRLGLRLSATHLFSRILGAGRTDKLLDAKSLQLYDNDDHLAFGRVSLRYTPARTRAELTLSYQRFFERKDDHRVADDLRTRRSTTRDENDVDTGGLDLQLVTRVLGGRLWLQYGGMWYRDWVDSVRLTGAPGAAWQRAAEASYPDGSTYDTYGGFVLAEGDVLRRPTGHVLRLNAGYRLHGMRGFAPDAGGLPEVEILGLGHVFTGSVQYLFGQRANATLSLAQGFRAPNLNEAVMLGDTGKLFHVPNGDLGPERLDTVEILLRGRWWRLTAAVAGHVSRLRDLIKRVEVTDEAVLDRWAATAGGKEIWWNVNGGDAFLFGTEVQLRLELTRRLSLSGNLAYTWGEERVPGGPDLPLTRIPPLFGVARLRHERALGRRWRGFGELYVLFAATQDRLSPEDEKDVRIPEGGTPGWWTVNLRLGAVRRRLRLGLTLENLLDTAYRYHGSGVYGAGASARLFVEADL